MRFVRNHCTYGRYNMANVVLEAILTDDSALKSFIQPFGIENGTCFGYSFSGSLKFFVHSAVYYLNITY